MTDPVIRFREIASRHDRCFWLDGGGSREWSGRRSLLGWLEDDDVSLTYDARTRQVIRQVSGTREVVGDDIFAVLATEMADDGPEVHWVGYFGYASRSDLPAALDPDDPMPTAVWMRATRVEIYDHDPVTAMASPHGPAPSPAFRAHRIPDDPENLHTARNAGEPGDQAVPDEYAAAFGQVQDALRAGNSYEVNLTYRSGESNRLDPVTAYLRLRELNPAPYAGFLQHDGRWLLSSSPERYASVDRDGSIVTKPIKGTMPRGATPEEDDQLRSRLATDPKNRAENLMIVDLLRNDLAMVCTPGSVGVPELMEVETYESVHQLVSSIHGQLREGVSTVAALRALFPAGSMTGAPKLRTMEIIEDVEASARGAYAGAFGWISGDGRADLGVVIRSLTCSGSAEQTGHVDVDRAWRFGTGGAITVRSELEDEWSESLWKADLLRSVLRG